MQIKIGWLKNTPFYMLIRTFRSELIRHRKYRKEYKRIRGECLKVEKPIFLMMLPTGGNLGDHAIAYAERVMLQKRFPEFAVIEVYNWFVYLDRKYNRLTELTEGHPLFLTGGGYIGTLWLDDAEKNMRHIINCNQSSLIIILPNTVFFDDNDSGRAELKNTQACINSHPNLQLFVRENVSFEKYRNCFNNIELMPDVVMSLSFVEPRIERNGCILCLRKDIEKTLGEEQSECIHRKAKQLFDTVTESDMEIDKEVSEAERYAEISKKISQFKSAELVITDRLHAMIFCAISATPCLVVKSKSHKVEGCYEWIRHCEYIRLIDSPDDIDLSTVRIEKEYNYNNEEITTRLNGMMDTIDRMAWRNLQ